MSVLCTLLLAVVRDDCVMRCADCGGKRPRGGHCPACDYRPPPPAEPVLSEGRIVGYLGGYRDKDSWGNPRPEDRHCICRKSKK